MIDDEPPIRKAIYFTQNTLESRAASYRNLVVIVSLGSCGLLLSSILALNWRYLLGSLLLFPLVYFWLWKDARRVRLWTIRVQEICNGGKLDIEVFRSTIVRLQYLPQNSLRGMLDLLPPNRTALPERTAEHALNMRQAKFAEDIYWANAAMCGIGCSLIALGMFISDWLIPVGVALCLAGSKLSSLLVKERNSS